MALAGSDTEDLGKASTQQLLAGWKDNVEDAGASGEASGYGS